MYDTETGAAIVQLFDENVANHYTRNRACFDPNDELVLNDGILFDPRVGPHGNVVHKFDKLNSDISGIFHPKSSEVIINSEVVSHLIKLSVKSKLTLTAIAKSVNKSYETFDFFVRT